MNYATFQQREKLFNTASADPTAEKTLADAGECTHVV